MHCLEAVAAKLDVREKMKLDRELETFVYKKNRSEILTNKMNIWEIFEPILPSIRELYDKKLSERDSDAFDDDIFCGVKIEDGLFYSNTFLPTALVYMYKHWLDYEVLNEEIYNELFSLGAGAKTMTLVPEVSSFCKECTEESLGDGELRQLNIAVFKKQISHKFLDPAFLRFFDKHVDDQMKTCELSDIEEETENCNPFVIDVESPIDIVRTNPFDSSSSDTEELFLDGCEFCCTTFPSEEFLALHKKIFHSKVLATKFVENAEELMVSISEGPEVEAVESSPSQPIRKAQQEAKKNNNKNVNDERSVKSKYKLRKCLKY